MNHLRHTMSHSIRTLARALPALAALGVLAATHAAAADQVGSSFTFQGRLDTLGAPANGEFDLRFQLAWDTQGDASLGTIYRDDIEVTDGLFTVELDFGSLLFNDFERFLLMSVRPGSVSNADRFEASYTSLLPWQSIRPTPYAIYAARAGSLNLPIDEHVNFLGTTCLKIRNDVSVAIAGHSDDFVGVWAESVDGTGLWASSTNGWAGSFNGKVYVSQAIGIGTAAISSFKLAVNGSAAKPGGGSWSTLSDRRTKHDIQPLRGALATLLALQGVTYEYNPEWIEEGLALPGRQIGFVAQEVEAVLPEWVEAMPDGTRYITERGATALVVEAIRELEAKRLAAEAEVAELRRTVEELAQKLDALAPTTTR